MEAKELADREAIRELLVHYGHLLDTRQPERIAAEFFTADGVDEHGTITARGPEEITRLFQGVCDVSEGHAHVFTNFHIEVDGERAHSRSYFTAWHWMKAAAAQGPNRPADFVSVGWYEDELRREPAGWRVAHRRVGSAGPGFVAVGSLPDFESAVD